MLKRILNLVLLLLIPIGLVALVTAFSSNKGATATATKIADVAANPGYAPEGIWSDLPALPTVTLGFGSGTYGTAAPGPLKLKRASAVAYPPNGKVYILGGRHKADGDDITSPWIWEFTPGGSTYTRKTTLIDSVQYGTNAAANMATVVLTNSAGVRIYAVGGSTVNSAASNLTRVYDPVADSLTQDDVWPASPARIPGGYAVYNNKLYIFGGYNPAYTNVVYADTWVFDPMAAAGSRWSQLNTATLSIPRAYIGGAELDGYIYAIGGDVISGVVSTTVVPQTVVERMHPADANPTWLPVASLPTARGDMGVWSYDSGLTYEISGKIVVGGGSFPSPDSSAYIYDPGANSWSTFASLLRNRRDIAYTQYNGILYAFGGYNVGTSYDGANDSMSYDGSTGGATSTPTVAGTPPTSTAVATNTSVPSNTAVATNTSVPTNTNTAVPTNTATSVPPTNTNTPVPPTNTSVPPTNTGTSVPGTNTPVPPTSTSVPATNTSVPATSTSVPATGTSVPPTGTIPATSTSVPATSTSVPATETVSGTSTEVPATATAVPTATQIACSIQFSDVPDGSTFYSYIHCLACLGIVNGYPDGTFLPENPVTRGQIAKIASNAAGWNDEVTGQTFTDVTPDSTFYTYVELMSAHNAMQGYPCGGAVGPCDNEGRPYFLPNNNASRGQIAKIVSQAAGFNDAAGAQMYKDVPSGSTFYPYVNRLTLHGVVSGYACGGAGEPCGTDNLPYFRSNNTATRGQATKFISLAFTINCSLIGR